jgi:deoxycytidine triphosphate deaminase
LPFTWRANEEGRGNERIGEDGAYHTDDYTYELQRIAMIGVEEARGSQICREEKLPRLDSNQDEESQNFIAVFFASPAFSDTFSQISMPHSSAAICLPFSTGVRIGILGSIGGS